MDFIQRQNRSQVSFGCLEDSVETDNPVRLIDAFTEQLELKSLGFTVKELKSQGRPAFESRVLLNLYFYGYLSALNLSWKNSKIGNRIMRGSSGLFSESTSPAGK